MYINKLIYTGCSFVVLNVVGSSPTVHPKRTRNFSNDIPRSVFYKVIKKKEVALCDATN